MASIFWKTTHFVRNLVMDNFQNLYHEISKIIEVSPQDWEKFKSLWKQVNLSKGDFFVEQGERSEYAGFLVKGYITNNYVTGDGKEVIKLFQFENNFIGSLASLDGGLSLHSVKAMENSIILQAKIKDITDLIKTSPIWETLSRKMVEKAFFEKQHKEHELMTFSAKERYLSLKDSLGENIDRISKKDISLYLGIDPATLSRLLK